AGLHRLPGVSAPTPGRARFVAQADRRPFSAAQEPLPLGRFLQVAAAPAPYECRGNSERAIGLPNSLADRPRTVDLSCILPSFGRTWPKANPKCWATTAIVCHTFCPSNERVPGDEPAPK